MKENGEKHHATHNEVDTEAIGIYYRKLMNCSNLTFWFKPLDKASEYHTTVSSFHPVAQNLNTFNDLVHSVQGCALKHLLNCPVLFCACRPMIQTPYCHIMQERLLKFSYCIRMHTHTHTHSPLSLSLSFTCIFFCCLCLPSSHPFSPSHISLTDRHRQTHFLLSSMYVCVRACVFALCVDGSSR